MKNLSKLTSLHRQFISENFPSLKSSNPRLCWGREDIASKVFTLNPHNRMVISHWGEEGQAIHEIKMLLETPKEREK